MARKRITDFNSLTMVSLMGLLPDGKSLPGRYSLWMHRACREAFEQDIHVVKHAKMTLGPQDYCYMSWHRNWVWVRPYDVDFGGGRVETWRWRLFVSSRGHSLEIEDKSCIFNDPRLVFAADQGLDHFIKTWTEAAGWENDEGPTP